MSRIILLPMYNYLPPEDLGNGKKRSQRKLRGSDIDHSRRIIIFGEVRRERKR
jgi:hypothetical protein